MNISYSNKIKKKISDDYHISKNFDSKTGLAIKMVISLLSSAKYLNDIPNVPPTRRHKLTDGNWAIDVSKNYRMILINISNSDDPIKIDAMIILDICDYH